MRNLKVIYAILAGLVFLLYGTCPRAKTNSEQQADPWGGAVYLEILGRSFFLGSIHVELPIVDGLAMELGGAISPGPNDVLMVFWDMGLSYWVWSSGSSSVVVGASLCYQAGETPRLEDRHYEESLSAALGAFYEFRDGILVRLGLIPQVSLWRNGDFMMYQYPGARWYDYFQFVALQVGWAF